ncbi:hypothetical protein [Candidatus Nesciobacter abundans]|uniref:DUF2497 domain-containing protein n=1 Tax=Candidatus Nesciobacter abundans TaxID=2601668 RepID=A0A5C0UGP8_9PROT|nr:hypothetical protein [Candidatus Nesciobacter abundans]QEK39295.1 hypothetical protein FZC36_02585 [Candidatus Nesciobacter abundans]
MSLSIEEIVSRIKNSKDGNKRSQDDKSNQKPTYLNPLESDIESQTHDEEKRTEQEYSLELKTESLNDKSINPSLQSSVEKLREIMGDSNHRKSIYVTKEEKISLDSDIIKSLVKPLVQKWTEENMDKIGKYISYSLNENVVKDHHVMDFLQKNIDIVQSIIKESIESYIESYRHYVESKTETMVKNYVEECVKKELSSILKESS